MLWQPDRGRGYRFNLDPVLLSGFAHPGGHTLDLGAGCGVLGILLLASGRAESVTAVEVQPTLAELARRNAAQNGFAERMRVLCGDIRVLTLPAAERVVFNPPYFRSGDGRGAPEEGRDLARHERRGTLADFVVCADAHLVPGGIASAVVPVARGEELRGLFAARGLAPVRERAVHARQDRPQSLMLASAQKRLDADGGHTRGAGRPPGSPPISAAAADMPSLEPPLLVHAGADNGYSEEVLSLLSGP